MSHLSNEDDEPAIMVESQIGPWAMVPVWVLSRGLNGSELAVYVALRSFADRGGAAHPSIRAIAERSGVSMSTAKRALAALRDKMLIRWGHQYRADGSMRASVFWIRDTPPATTVSDEKPLNGGGVSPATTPGQEGGGGVSPATTPGHLVSYQEQTIELTKDETEALRASAPPAQMSLLPASPPTATESQGVVGNRIAKIYCDRQPMSRFPAIAQIVRRALAAGYHEDVITSALERLRVENRSVTLESLRVELDGPPALKTRSTTDERVQAGLDLMAKFRAERERSSVSGPTRVSVEGLWS